MATTITEQATHEYMGIADANGIESFTRLAGLNLLHLRAMIMYATANRHRHAVAYIAEVKEEDARLIQALLKGKMYIEALEMLKLRAVKVRADPAQAGSWRRIPNPDLDPYR
jgi:hypothetical protein